MSSRRRRTTKLTTMTGRRSKMKMSSLRSLNRISKPWTQSKLVSPLPKMLGMPHACLTPTSKITLPLISSSKSLKGRAAYATSAKSPKTGLTNKNKRDTIRPHRNPRNSSAVVARGILKSSLHRPSLERCLLSSKAQPQMQLLVKEKAPSVRLQETRCPWRLKCRSQHRD